MSNDDSGIDDVEFYSFVQVNEDLSNSQEHNSQLIQDSQNINLLDQKEINQSNQNVVEEQFFKKLSQAFYSTKNNFTKAPKKNSINQEELNNLQSKNCLESQNTQPQTPKNKLPTKSEDQTEIKGHHLFKNYQIKKVQKHLTHMDQTSYENSSVKKQQVSNMTNQDKNVQQPQEFNINERPGNNQDSNQKSKKQIFVQKNTQNNIGNQQSSLENQQFNTSQSIKQIHTQINQPNQRYHTNEEVFSTKASNQRMTIQNKIAENGSEKQRAVHSNQEFQKLNQQNADEIDTVILTDRQNLQKKQIHFVNQYKKEILNDLYSNQLANQEQKDLKLHQQWLPLSSRATLTKNYNPNILNSLRKNLVENNYLEASDNVLQKQLFIHQKKQIFINKLNKNEINPNNFNQQSFKRNSDQEKMEETQGNFINTQKQILNERNKDENPKNLNNILGYDSNQIIQNDIDLRQRIKEALNNKFTPQQKKNIALNLEQKGLTTPRHLLKQNNNGSQTVQSKQNLMHNLQFNNKDINNLKEIQQTSLTNRDIIINNSQKIDGTKTKKIVLERPQKQMSNQQIQKRFNPNNLADQNNQLTNSQIQQQQQLTQSNFNESIRLSNSLKISLANSHLINQETENNKPKNNFFSQVFKSKTIQTVNKYQIKNQVTTLPLSNSQKIIENTQIPLQTYNNFSLKNVTSQKTINLNNQSSNKKKIVITNLNVKKVESISNVNLEEEFLNSQKVD